MRAWLLPAVLLIAASACRRQPREVPVDAGEATGPWIESPAVTGSPPCMTERACQHNCEDERGEDCTRAASFQMLRGNMEEMRALHLRACNFRDAAACVLVDDRARALEISARACKLGDGRACYQHSLIDPPPAAQLDLADQHACRLGAAEACLASAVRNRDAALLSRARKLAEAECARGEAAGCLVRMRARIDADDRDRWLNRARRIYVADCKAGYLPSCHAGSEVVESEPDAAVPLPPPLPDPAPEFVPDAALPD